MTTQKQRPKLLEKMAYGMGDAGCNIVGGAVFLFLNYYYTDVYGLSAVTVGFIWFGVRMIEAISDPLVGGLADRTRTRWGKFRPYILFFALPYALLCILMFTRPDFSAEGKAWYAFITFLLMSLAYSFINIPYVSLGSVISYHQADRVACQSWRFMGVGVATLILTLSLLPMVSWLGAGDKALGYQRSIALLSMLGLAMFLICFSLVRERVRPVSTINDTLRNNLRAMRHNDQWLPLLLVTFVNALPGFIRMAVTFYFLRYVMSASEGYITLFMSAGVVGMIIGSALARPLSDRFCKLSVFFWISLFLTFWSAGMFLLPTDASLLFLLVYFVLNIVHQIAQPINWAIMADIDDYGEWKTGQRLTGINFSCNFLSMKLGMTLSAVLVNWILSQAGYQEGGMNVQSETTLTGIQSLFCLLPALCYLATALCVRLLRIDRVRMYKIERALESRKAAIIDGEYH